MKLHYLCVLALSVIVYCVLWMGRDSMRQGHHFGSRLIYRVSSPDDMCSMHSNMSHTHLYRIREACQAIPSLDNTCDRDMRFLLADTRQRLVYGQIPKVASTNWICLLAQMSGHVSLNMSDHASKRSLVMDRRRLDQLGLRYFQHLPSYDINRYLKTYYKFTFVRHPFTRLVSAYRNKLNPGQTWYRERYGRLIKKQFRHNGTTISNSAMVTFREFVRYLVYMSSFPGNVFDEHWAPYHRLVCPCTVQYDFVGKLETLAEDFRDVMKNGFNASKLLVFPPETQEHLTGSTDKVVKSYFETLSDDEVRGLLDIYGLDLYVFRYSAAPFIPSKWTRYLNQSIEGLRNRSLY